ncbi:hypothetical protein [Acinetobacter sp.]|uniref:hypothetical protein n=1 Tax=Acinetobacter sp. TaxID=472 RepID=UPI000C0B862E|nr:hypothetical protein [Acinetobacter sp.]MAK29813.1 hypothetical protein [Acinetobacter sp.]
MATSQPARGTHLNAINTMLSAIGESPTTRTILDAESSADVVMAKQILDEVNKEVQAQGWHFNTEYEVEFTPDGSTKHIVLGTNIARIDLAPDNEDGRDVIVKYTSGEYRLYDKKDKTYEFSGTVKATVVYFYDFIHIPHAAQHYITIKASRVYQDRLAGTQTHHAFSMQDEFRALADLKDWEGATADHYIFDTISTFRVIKRGSVIT